MASKRWHADGEIAAKLAQAKQLAAEGKTQSEIANILGISVMTYHRWRNAHRGLALTVAPERQKSPDAVGKIAELQLENSRLRQLVTDLLLEKVQLQEESDQARSINHKRIIP
jgi:putative transposase